MVTAPQTNKHANTQTGPITIHCAAKLSAQCNEQLIVYSVCEGIRSVKQPTPPSNNLQGCSLGQWGLLDCWLIWTKRSYRVWMTESMWVCVRLYVCAYVRATLIFDLFEHKVSHTVMPRSCVPNLGTLASVIAEMSYGKTDGRTDWPSLPLYCRSSEWVTSMMNIILHCRL